MSYTGVLPEPSVPPIIGIRAGWLWPGHHVIVQSWEGKLAVVCLIGPDGVKPADSAADWEVIDRPRAPGITEWQGRHNKRLELDLIIDGWVTRAGGGLWIEDHIATLEEMLDTPLTCRLVGPIPFWGLRYAITSLDYGEEMRDIVTGRRMRQRLTMHVVEYIQPEDLEKLPRAGAEPAQTRQYTIVKGDDLQKIAQKTLGKAARWQEIEKLNPPMRGIKLDAKQFPAGKKIKVPAK
jgi:LysM domain